MLSKVYIEEEYILMSEPDHVFLQQVPMLASPNKIVAWPFWYMQCEDEKIKPHCMNPAFNPLQIPAKNIPRVRS
jgi:hypothetical protein